MERSGDRFDVSVSLDEGATYESVANPDEGKDGFSELALGDSIELGIVMNGHNGGASTGTARVVDITLNGVDAIAAAVEPGGKLATTWAAIRVDK
jgi:hypothetical protein